MDRKKAYMIAVTGALIMSVIGASFVGLMSLNGAFEASSSDGSADDDGEHPVLGTPDGEVENLRANGSGDVPPTFGLPEDGETQKDGLPWYIYAGIALSIICVLAVASISGRAYMESSRHENLVRNDLVDLIAINPGINLTTIRNELQLSQGAVSYHLQRLEKVGMIYSQKGIKERRYYPASMGYRKVEDQSAQDEIRTILSNPTTQAIVENLRGGERTQNQIVKEIGVTPSTVHWHMERLEHAGLIRKRREGRTVVYSLRKPGAET